MNTIVTTHNDQLVTTTIAIAEGTLNDHASVIKLVRTYQEDLEEFGLVRFEIRPRLEGQHGGGDVEYAELNEQQSTLILTYMRNTEIIRKFKKRLVKEFWEMRNQQPKSLFVLPQNYVEALEHLLEAKKHEMVVIAERDTALADATQKQKLLEVVQPKAQALDRISTFAEGAMCITNAAKVLQLQPKKFFAWLQEKQWIYRRAGGSGWVGYQSRIQVGYLEHKVTTIERTDGSTKQVEQVLVTAKGLAKLATDFGSLELMPA